MSFTSTPARADILMAGIGSWWVKKTNTTADAAYYALGPLYEGKISVKSLSQNDSKQQNIASSAVLAASSKLYSTGKTNVLKILDTLGSNEIDHIINLVNGTAITSNGLTVKKFGTKWKFVCDADSDKSRYIEITANRKVALTELTALLTGSAPALGTQVGTDVLYPLAALSRSDVVPAGFAKVEVRLNPAGSYQDIGALRNGKLTIELLGQDDSLGMFIGSSVKIDVAFDAFQASATELGQVSGLLTQINDYKITLLDGTLITLNGQCGVDTDYKSDADSDKNSYITYSGQGVVALSALDAIFA